MKLKVLGLVLGGFATSFAVAAPSVKITSFLSAGRGTKAAEVCGVVSGISGTWSPVKIIVDHDGERPGSYNTIVDAMGKFCVSVVTFNGTAKAEVWSPAFYSAIVSEPAVIALEGPRVSEKE